MFNMVVVKMQAILLLKGTFPEWVVEQNGSSRDQRGILPGIKKGFEMVCCHPETLKEKYYS
jgi:hypothetical protein